MSDIVVRLRTRDAYLSLDEAADEIERLRGLLRAALPAVQSYARKHGRAVMAAARRNDADHAAKHAEIEKSAWCLADRIRAALGAQANSGSEVEK